MTTKIKIFLCVLALTFCGVAALYNRIYLEQLLNSYVSKKTAQELGALVLNPSQEEKIKQIAAEMDITESFIIRRMNQSAMAIFGYHNAFAYFPLLLTCIPTNSEPYLFVSEGFFEDLSPEEQLFIIGHELIHIRERHTIYLNLILYALFLLLLTFCYLITKRILKAFQGTKYPVYLIHGACCVITFICLFVPNLFVLAYRRHIERVADCQSLQILKTYEGCTKLVNRWQKEFQLLPHNPYFGLLSDHPSCEERKLYCLELRNKSKDTL